MLRRFRWPLLVVGVLFLVVGLPLLVGHFQVRAEFAEDARGLPAQVARARALGLPLSWAELEPRWKGTADDAWPHYEKAIALYEKVPESSKIPHWEDSPDFLNRKRYVEAARLVWPHLERVVAYPHCWTPHEWNRSLGEASWELHHLYRFVELAATRASIEAHEGRHDLAWDSLLLSATICRHTADSPTLTRWSGQAGVEPRVLAVLSTVLATSDRSQKAVASARRVFEALGPPPGMHQMMVGYFMERFTLYNQLELLEEFEEGSLDGLNWWDRLATGFAGEGLYSMRVILPSMQSLSVVEQAFQARMLDRWISLFERTGGKWDDLSRVRKEIESLRREVDSGNHRADRIEQQLPFYEGLWESQAEAMAYRNTTESGLDVLEFEAREGRWPKSLAEAGADRVDPYDGKPLTYTVHGPGFTIGSSHEWKFSVK